MANATVKDTLAERRIRQDLDHNRITPRSPQLCLGFHALVKVLHHHDHMRAEEMFGRSRFLLCLFLPILCHGKIPRRDRRSLRPHLENHMSSVSMVI